MRQMNIDFEPGLVERHASLIECIRTSVYSSGKPMKVLAADMDLSQSELSRKLADNPNDPRKFTVDDFEALLSTGDLTPLYYLVEKYLTSESDRQRAKFTELERKLPEIMNLIKSLGVSNG